MTAATSRMALRTAAPVRRAGPAAVAPRPSVAAAPALAEEKGVLFDFNATLPVMGAEFLLLMLALDLILFKPVAKVLDERDEKVRGQLADVGSNSDEISRLQAEADKMLSEARQQVSAEMAAVKAETSAECEAKLEATKARIEKELASAMAALEKEEADTLEASEAQVAVLSDDIVKKVLGAAY